MPNRRYRLPPLAFFQGFEAAARNLSFTRAAQELFITQSAVSRQIKALEQHLGVMLFERRPRALVLTEQGAALQQVTADVLERPPSRRRRDHDQRPGAPAFHHHDHRVCFALAHSAPAALYQPPSRH